MATFPSFAIPLTDTVGETFDPSVLRTEMERGVPKERIENSRVLATVSMTVLFTTKADANAFVDWYFDTIGRIGWFDFTHPRTGQTLQARFVGGQIGSLKAESGPVGRHTCPLSIEYLR